MSNFKKMNDMEVLGKNQYVPPLVEINPVALDAGIAVQSPIRKIDVEDWEEEELTPDTGDIFIAI